MKIFLCWSGSRSKEIAEALKDWLPYTIQAIETWMSTSDIDMGSRWNIDLVHELEQTDTGILCITPESMEAPWILFEAGALSKMTNARVCPYLLGLEPTDLKGPLVQFQATIANKEGTKELVKTINRNLGSEALSEELLNRIYDTHWHELELSLQRILENRCKVESPYRSDRDMLKEVLEIVRDQSNKLSDLKQLVQERISFDELFNQGFMKNYTEFTFSLKPNIYYHLRQ